MFDNIFSAETLRSLSRRKSRDREFRTVRNHEVPEYVADGWETLRENKTTTRLSKAKARAALLEDRVWSLLYTMGFNHLSGDGGAFLQLDPKKTDSSQNQIDVVGLDAEIAIAVECKSALVPRKDSRFRELLTSHSLIRERFANTANTQFPLDHKRVPWAAQIRLSAACTRAASRGATVVVSNAWHASIRKLYPDARAEKVRRLSLVSRVVEARRVVHEYLFLIEPQ